MKDGTKKSKKSLLTPDERKNADILKEVAAGLGLGAQDLTRQRMIVRVGSMLSSMRQRIGLTQGEMADRSGLTQPYVSRLENGLLPVRGPTLDVLVRCASAAGCDLELSFRSRRTGDRVGVAGSQDLPEPSKDEDLEEAQQDLPAVAVTRAGRLVRRFDAQADLVIPYDEIDVLFGGQVPLAWSASNLRMGEESEDDAASLTSAYEQLGRARLEVNELLQIKEKATRIDVDIIKGARIFRTPKTQRAPIREFTDEDDRERIYSIGKRILETLRSVWPMYKRLSKDESSNKHAHIEREKIEVARDDLVVIGFDHEMHFSSGSSSNDPHKMNIEDFETFGRHKHDS